MTRRSSGLLLAFALALPGAADAAPVDGIDWWKGDVAQAFAVAKEQNKPLFIYWGAVWCPPCNQIKKTIFTRREFQAKMQAFLPVYLDGDTESAQVWGEKLGAQGYPTMLVFNPAGEEIMRMPTGLQVEAFCELLDEAMETATPVKTVLEQALAGTPTDAQLRTLAYYSWGQDTFVGLDAKGKEEAFRKLDAKTPDRLAREKSRFFTLWLDAATNLASDDPTFKLTEADRSTADARLRALLSSREQRAASLEFVLLAAKQSVAALHPAPSPARTQLIQLWETTAEAIEKDESLSVDERLTALVPTLEFLQMELGKAPVPTAFRERVAARVAWADENANDAFTRQAAMSTAGWLLRQVGLTAEAKALYESQLTKAVSPYYFMSSLASLAQKDGDKKGALTWMRRAYDEANGRATRFQWGTSYLLGLMDLAPEDAATIEKESQRVLSEVLAFDDAFAGRNHARIKRLNRGFAEWNANGKHAASCRRLREAMAQACTKVPDQGAEKEASQRDRCEAFFTTLGNGEAS